MKKTFIIFIIISLLGLSSCLKEEKAQDYNFRPTYTANMIEEERQEVFNEKVDYCKTFDYFKNTPHKYHGKYSEVSAQAYADFSKACKEIGDKPISEDLLDGEIFRIILVNEESGYVVGYTDWTKDYWLIEE